jgi:hypothetical protein
MQGARRGRLDRRVHGAPWQRCARSIIPGRSLASLRRVRAASPSGRSLRAAAVPPYDRASPRQPRSRLPRQPDRLTAPGVQVCGVFWQPLFMARLICALTGTDSRSGNVECRRLGGSAADDPDGVVTPRQTAAAAGSDPLAGRPALGAVGVPGVGSGEQSRLHLPVRVDQIRIERCQRPLRIDGHLVEDGAENCSFPVQAVVGPLVAQVPGDSGDRTRATEFD